MPLTLGQKLRGLREAKGWTLAGLSSLARIDQAQLSRYEKDAADPKASSLAALSSALDVRVGYLFHEIPDLEGIVLTEVAARESLRIFVSGSKLSRTAALRYWSTVDLPAAPRTLQGWKDLHELIHRMRGTKGES